MDPASLALLLVAAAITTTTPATACGCGGLRSVTPTAKPGKPRPPTTAPD